MNFFVQYHNADKLGYLPGEVDYHDGTDVSTLDTSDAPGHCISSAKPDIRNALGDVAFMIVGYGRGKRRYALWSWTLLEEIIDSDEPEINAVGECAVLNPPAELAGLQFDQFKKHVGNFGLGFQKITDHEYVDTLVRLAVAGSGVDFTASDDPLLFNTVDAASAGMERDGYFDPPPDSEEFVHRVLAEVAVRRGQARFRDSLLIAYEGKCAVTGSAVAPALEAAHIVPVADSPYFDPSNGLLLRADIHSLFDLGLLTIDPESRQVRLHDSLQKTEYSELDGRKLAEPLRSEWRPSKTALARRIKLFAPTM